MPAWKRKKKCYIFLGAKNPFEPNLFTCQTTNTSGQNTIIPKPELKAFWEPGIPFGVTSAEVAIIYPEYMHEAMTKLPVFRRKLITFHQTKTYTLENERLAGSPQNHPFEKDKIWTKPPWLWVPCISCSWWNLAKLGVSQSIHPSLSDVASVGLRRHTARKAAFHWSAAMKADLQEMDREMVQCQHSLL